MAHTSRFSLCGDLKAALLLLTSTQFILKSPLKPAPGLIGPPSWLRGGAKARCANVAICRPASIRTVYVTQTRLRNFVFHCHCLRLVDSVAFDLLPSAWMPGTGRARRFYARLRSDSTWRNSYGFLIAQRHTTHQKKTIVVLGFLAYCDGFRDCSPRCNCSYRARNLLHSISSLREGGRHVSELPCARAVRSDPISRQVLFRSPCDCESDQGRKYIGPSSETFAARTAPSSG